MTAYEQYNGKYCVLWPAADEAGVSLDLWKKWGKQAKQYGYAKRPGGNGRDSLLQWEAIPPDYRALLAARYGEPQKVHHPLLHYYVIDTGARAYYDSYLHDDGTSLTEEQKARYTINASVLQAALKLLAYRQTEWAKKGRSPRGAIHTVVEDVKSFNTVLKREGAGLTHNLPEHPRKLREKIFAYAKAQDPYALLIDKRTRNTNAAKVKTAEQEALLEKLISRHTNLNNQQVALMYNEIADRSGWKRISAGTVANRRAEMELYTYSQQHGATELRNRKAMLVKRKAPSYPLYYWTLDGWDAELLYQHTGINEKGQKVTTYTNRLTIVVVLDPVQKIKYPIGYAIGDKESPELIMQALRNACQHTAELFGQMYMPLQLQSDRYGNGTLTPAYEAITLCYTPARARNAKAKVVEPYFRYINERYCKLFDNWSGYGLQADPMKQPNDEYLDKIKKQFPDRQGCVEQLVKIMEWERKAKREAYLQAWVAMPEADKHPLPAANYLRYFGHSTGYAYKLHTTGFTLTIEGEDITWDSFDIRLREHARERWLIYYDPADLSRALAVNARVKDGKPEIIGSIQVELERVHVQPMALRDRTEGDAEALARVNQFNRQLEAKITERIARVNEAVEGVLQQPGMDDTLTKLVLTNSLGQHKDEKNRHRAISAPKQPPLPPAPEEQWEVVNDDVRDQY